MPIKKDNYMNVLLISPYGPLTSYGVRMLSACLKNNGHESTIVFLPDTKENGLQLYNNSTINQLTELARQRNLIGISLMSNYYCAVKDLCLRLKERLNTPIVLGGVHPTVSYHDCLSFSDYIFRGESELAFSKFVNNLESASGCRLPEIENLIYKKNGEVFVNPIKLPLELDTLPLPDYQETHYIIKGDKTGRLTKKTLNYFTQNEYILFATRGCPFQCSYCCNNAFRDLYKGNPVLRKKSVANVIEEALWAKENLDAYNLCFDDDAFMSLSDEYLKEFVELYRKKVNLPLSITSINPQMASVIENKLDILKPLNITSTRMGIQSGSERIRKNIYLRNDSNNDIIKTANALADRGINYTIDIITDNPYEEEKDTRETILLISRLRKAFTIHCFSLAMYPGTSLYEKAIKDGLITPDWEKTSKTHYGYYRNSKPTPMNSLILHCAGVPENLAKGIIELKKRNIFLFGAGVKLVIVYSKFRFLIIRSCRIIAILRKEGGKRLLNRAIIRFKKLCASANKLAYYPPKHIVKNCGVQPPAAANEHINRGQQ